VQRTRSLAVLLAVLALPARAQSDLFSRGIDTIPFKLAPGLNSGLALDGAELLPVGSWGAQALLDLNLGILALKQGDQRLGDLIPFRGELHLLGAWQVHARVELSADLPITFHQTSSFSLLTGLGFQQEEPRAAGLGAPRLQGRFQLLRQDEVPIVGLTAIAEVRFPLGDTFSFLSDRGFVFAPRLAVERALGPVRLLLNLGYRFRTAPGQYLNLYVGHEFTAGLGGILALPSLGPTAGNQVLLELNLATPAEAPFTFAQADALKTPLELMLGVRTRLFEHWQLQLSVGRGLGENGYGRESFRFSLGVAYVDLQLADRDGDGIPDDVDQCPDLAETRNGFEDEDGCPDVAPDPDRDGDGVPDAVDRCPDAAGPEDLEGCPDRDGDHVADIVDLCPDAAGPAALQGCPDRDGDQIPDVADACPDQPGPPDLNGCPPPEAEEPVVLESQRIRINDQILFEFGSDRIDPRSLPLLDDVARVLQDNPEVGPVMIEGHTDNIGSRPINLDLSRRRAHSVELYLTSRGVSRERLRSEGYGFDRPVAPNDTPLNRARNRRTEFKLVEAPK
jgi:outer membrane protein OmpA-like peptidoglycan-associated protein